MTAARRKFTQDFKDEFCREVINTSKPIKDVADAYGVGPETLRNWLIKHREANGGSETELTVPERAQFKELDREVQELKAEAQFQKKQQLDYRAGAAVASRYEFIDSQKCVPTNRNPVVKMCRWMGVSTSGFYHGLTRPQSATSARREAPLGRIRHYFEESDATYGYRRIHADLAAEQTQCSPELVRQMMRREGLVACQPRPFRVTTQADVLAAANMPDLAKRDFTADRPGVKFVGDITYVHTWQGFVHPATVIDCFSKKVVGWPIADHMRTKLVADALKNATATTLIEPDAIWHSDRGSVLHLGRFPGLGDRPADAIIHGSHRRVLGQQYGRIVLLDAQNERVHRNVYATKAQARKDLIATSRCSTRVDAGTQASVTDGPTKSTMVIKSQPWQRRKNH